MKNLFLEKHGAFLSKRFSRRHSDSDLSVAGKLVDDSNETFHQTNIFVKAKKVVYFLY